MFDNKDFFPTPEHLIKKMLEDIDLKEIVNVLEPSAGKGDMVDYILKRNNKIKVDCIEIDENLRHVLTGKKYRIVNDDFLTFETFKMYSLILANFPFSNGDKHLRKALEMLENSGGKLCCLVNAETIKNPYSNLRKEIITILEKNGATIDFLSNQFVDAERKTNVEVALIKCKVKKEKRQSIILEELKKAQEQREKEIDTNYVVTNDFIEAIIKQYEFECRVGVKLIEEYKELKRFTNASFEKNDAILNLNLSGDSSVSFNEKGLRNRYLKKLRYKYWAALFNNREFTKLFTSNIRQDFNNKIVDLSNYEFNKFNIMEIKKQLNMQISIGVKDTIASLFEEFSHKYYWDKENSGNIHLYNGWKSNSCYKINKKVIIPLDAFSYYDRRFETNYRVLEKLTDIEKVFNYLETENTEELSLRDILINAQRNCQTKGVITKYFKLDFYKKGTTHLTFLNEELLKKFNIFGAMSKGDWLPPSYGKKQYKDMEDSERQAIDNFEGEKEYNKVLSNSKYYIYEENNFLLE